MNQVNKMHIECNLVHDTYMPMCARSSSHNAKVETIGMFAMKTV